ncbi:actin depolymerizing protein [Meira miltonrushii]|uniref:Actin depolymerizing protein n=1 Tax=Meira miltonrushii TaxID=1280837 RepID=A0A316VDX2_9BASI|nr:actin depolymerizing protein [Meira miltonrushii]PWN33655.1 actin depolymerizing protein [Meira miltonrushii]
MSNIPIDDSLKKLFDDITQGRSGEDPERAILVQNDNGILRLIESAPAKGSDREDFDDVLGKLFANEPTKPGYALYRLDSKSPAGLFEWINCAFRPEGAKVREKMQYSITQASLFKGLNEQHFLETVYGATSREFSFPSRLRNSRKHDYQNPQLSTKGKSASEAAGTDAGGLRRNFEALAAGSGSSNGSSPAQATNAPTKLVATMPDVATSVQAEPKAVPQASPSPSPADQPSVTAAQKIEEPSQPEPLPEAEKEVKVPEPEPAPKSIDTAVQDEPVKDEPTSVIPKDEKAEEWVQVSKPTTEASESSASATNEPEEAKPEPISLASKTAVPAVAAASVATSSAAASSTREEELKSSTPASTDSQQEKAIPTPTTQSTSSIGVGKGAGGLETEREKQLAELKSEESRYKSSASSQQGAGGPHTGFAWSSDVDGALIQLAKSGSSSASANLVVLKLDLSKEEVQLAGEPQSVEPSGLTTALSSSNVKEPSYAFYAHPELQTSENQESHLAIIYICPASSTVRQRMLYSVNLAVLSNRVDGFDGIKIVKRTETSDVEDLTPEFLADALSLSSAAGSQQNGGANAFSRPKRPGRR